MNTASATTRATAAVGRARRAVNANFAGQGLVRPRDGRLLAGVCVGVARRLGMDPWAVRALFLLTLFALPGSQFLVYPLMWLLMPEEAPAPVDPLQPPTA